MKQNSNLLCAGLLFSIGLWAATAVGQTALTIGNVPAYPGTTVSVPINLRQPPGAAVAAQFDMTFNAAKVGANGAVGTTRLPRHTVKSREIVPGVRRTLVYSLDNSNVPGTNGPIVTIPFAVSPVERIGSGPVTPGNVILARADGTALAPVTLGSGEIFVRPVNPLPDGSVQFFLPSTNDQRYAIQTTTNFVQWLSISTNVATGDFLNLLDTTAHGLPYRFYRWELLPP